MVTVIEPGKLVKVEPDALTADDILEFGAAMIEEQGHVVGESGDANRGWSIHGAIGEAARRATGSRGKDDYAARPLRDRASAQVLAHHGRHEHEVSNDAPTPLAAADAMRASMGAEVV